VDFVYQITIMINRSRKVIGFAAKYVKLGYHELRVVLYKKIHYLHVENVTEQNCTSL
jgi:hypothetical protein